MTQPIPIICQANGKQVGEIIGPIYFTTRKECIHYMNMYDGFGNSESVLRQNQGFNTELVIIGYIHDHTITYYSCPLVSFINSDKPWTDISNGVIDPQKFVSITDMDEISPEDFQMLITKFSGGINMTNKIGDVAKDYKSSNTKNIAELPEVSTELEVFDDEFETTDSVTKQLKVVKQKVISVNSVNYRVPASVFQQLKIIMEDNPHLKKFKVKKSGEGKDGTRYQVIPLM